jgi:hypothetical protein
MAATTADDFVEENIRSPLSSNEGDRARNVGSNDIPMTTSANRKAASNNGNDATPGDMMARLALAEHPGHGGGGGSGSGLGSPSTSMDAAGGARRNENGRTVGADILASDSLDVLSPSPRSQSVLVVKDAEEEEAEQEVVANNPYSGQFRVAATNKKKRNPSASASQALSALQNNAAAGVRGPNGPPIPPRTDRGEPAKSSSSAGVETASGGRIDEEEYVEEDEDESSEVSASDEDGSWITWFCSLRGNEFFCEVDEDYIQVSKLIFGLHGKRDLSTYFLISFIILQDDFNLTGLNSLVPYYDYALDMVLDVEMPMEDSLTEEQQEIVESAAVSVEVLCMFV